MNSYEKIYTMLVETQDKYWPEWSGTKRTTSLSPKELKELLKQIAQKQNPTSTRTTKSKKQKQATFTF